MSETPAWFDRLKRQARTLGAGVRPHHLAVAAVVAVLGIGFMTVRAVALPGPAPVLDGERLHIEVVAPVEPEILPGSVMEVGALVDGFEYTPPPRRAIEPAAYAPYDEDFEARDPRPAPKRYVEEAAIRPPPQPEESEGWRDSRAGRWFGFDEPTRDYRAERDARRARREAQSYDRDDRPRRWYRSDGRPVDRPEPRGPWERRDERDNRPPPDRWD